MKKEERGEKIDEVEVENNLLISPLFSLFLPHFHFRVATIFPPLPPPPPPTHSSKNKTFN